MKMRIKSHSMSSGSWFRDPGGCLWGVHGRAWSSLYPSARPTTGFAWAQEGTSGGEGAAEK